MFFPLMTRVSEFNSFCQNNVNNESIDCEAPKLRHFIFQYILIVFYQKQAQISKD